jgi:hypothetical protein
MNNNQNWIFWTFFESSEGQSSILWLRTIYGSRPIQRALICEVWSLVTGVLSGQNISKNKYGLYSRLERFCMGKLQKLIKFILKDAYILIWNNLCSTNFQKFECIKPHLGLKYWINLQKIQKIQFFLDFFKKFGPNYSFFDASFKCL